ncbi:hypothetical protein HCN44_001589 [Aphidius gifuensis]|uniref:Uncharacterized protein n=1 Tax=Aphidius gifuensis TaxID=684658 RepID=A0A835CPU9_APHGI|nr:uncharacterized protein LOC122853271 [Aphidius gifuensis]KAF7992264.1 hypothetical protein HCN44_001589 [Aphidius gifuensis]
MKMSIIFLFTLVLVITEITAGVGRSNSVYGLRNSRSNNRTNNRTNNENTKSSVQKLTSENNANGKIRRSGFGLSAWGLIALIIGAIVISTSGYYAFLFYPFLCKKERNYDMIELASV